MSLPSINQSSIAKLLDGSLVYINLKTQLMFELFLFKKKQQTNKYLFTAKALLLSF